MYRKRNRMLWSPFLGAAAGGRSSTKIPARYTPGFKFAGVSMVTRTCVLWPDEIVIAVGLNVIHEAADIGPLPASWNAVAPSSLSDQSVRLSRRRPCTGSSDGGDSIWKLTVFWTPGFTSTSSRPGRSARPAVAARTGVPRHKVRNARPTLYWQRQ